MADDIQLHTTEPLSETVAAAEARQERTYTAYRKRVTSERNPQSPAADKAKTPETPGSSEKPPAPDEGKSAEATGTSTTQEKPEKPEKPKPRRDKTAEERIAELTAESSRTAAENAELKRRVDELSKPRPAAEVQPPPKAAETPKPAEFSKPKPKLAEFVKDGKTYEQAVEEHADAVYAWHRERENFEADQKRQTEAQTTQQAEVRKRAEAVKAKHSDLEQVLGRVQVYKSTFDYAIASEHGLEALYQLGQDPARTAAFAAMPWNQQLRELAAIEASIISGEAANRNTGTPSPENPSRPQPQLVSRAPRPIPNFGGSDLSGDKKDPKEADDMQQYRERRKAQGAPSRF